MREKHMGISARLNSFWASMGCVHVHSGSMLGAVHVYVYKNIHGWLAAATYHAHLLEA
jgi:hypothetical protein